MPGTISYGIAGLNVETLPPFSVGFVNVLAVVALTMLFAPVGGRIAHSISQPALSIFFAVFLILTSLRMFYSLIS